MSVKRFVLLLSLLCIVALEVIGVFTVFDVIGTGGGGQNTSINGMINTPYYFMGQYPQTIKEASVIISTDSTVNGYYLGSDGAYYAKVVAEPYNSNYTFSNGETIIAGAEYYLKVEPIRWRVLYQEKGKAMLLCDTILESRAFDEYNNGQYSNNYAASDVRDWLNAQFYETAFTLEEKNKVRQENVDNSPASTGVSTNEYACENTFDRVFLLSVAEVNNAEWGFTPENRRMNTSDFSRATGAYMNTNDRYGCGWWWTRSPYEYGPIDVYHVSYDGDAGAYVGAVRSASKGVVPALWITTD